MELKELSQLAEQVERDCLPYFADVDKTEAVNTASVLGAFSSERVSETHFAKTTGYGYNDLGRETLERVFARITGAQDALVRHNFVSGTHALATALFGVLRPGDLMLCATGTPYDTILPVIGITKNIGGSLMDFGIRYRQVDLLPDGKLDINAVVKSAVGAKVLYIQRSRGYTLRPSLFCNDIEELIAEVRSVNPGIIAVVDNCYGEFVETSEPVSHGANLIVGSLIKNPGGGIATTGGYIAGDEHLVELCAGRLTTPATGREVGSTQGLLREMFMGLFLAPSIVANALKPAIFAARLFELAGYEVSPKYDEKRADIIQSIVLNDPRKLIAFCKGIQSMSPVDGFVTPIPAPMPGYDSEVIMAAGGFTSGSSIELSADAPLREPYAVWFQGGLTYQSAKLAIMAALGEIQQSLYKCNNK